MSRAEASCPACGATIEFRFATSVQTTCGYCNSVLVRTDLDLKKVGEVAELPPMVSPIQIGTEGIFRGKKFTVGGRIVYTWEQGAWNEWHIVFSDGQSGWLSDAQAQFAVTFAKSSLAALPDPSQAQPGATFEFDGEQFQVTSLTEASYAGVEGELPFEYWDKETVPFADLQTTDGRFGTIDYSESPPLLFLGTAVAFDELKLKNLKEEVAGAAKAKSLHCRSCGGAIELRAAGQTVSAVCIQCLSILDATTPALQIIQKFKAKQRVKPLIPLGTKGTFEGHTWEVIGFQVRSTVVDRTRYAWREYVLFDLKGGFRYLSEYDGHWNYIKPLDQLPQLTMVKGRKGYSFSGESFAHFQGGSATTDYVMGEFPWRVRVGERVQTDDYICPPRMLSAETSLQGITWSLGEYTTGAQIWRAFGLKDSPPEASGIYANQPSPYRDGGWAPWRSFFLLVLLLIVSILATNLTMADKVVFQKQYLYQPGTKGEASFVTPVFELAGRPSNVEVSVDTNLENGWIYLNLALINDETGKAWDWGREISYYHGADSDGSWSEGGRSDSSTLGQVPPGRYYLRVEPDWEAPTQSSSTPAPEPVLYTIKVKRDVPQFWYYPVILVFLFIPPLLRSVKSLRFETRRWEDSQYPPTGGGSSSDDDD